MAGREPRRHGAARHGAGAGAARRRSPGRPVRRGGHGGGARRLGDGRGLPPGARRERTPGHLRPVPAWPLHQAEVQALRRPEEEEKGEEEVAEGGRRMAGPGQAGDRRRRLAGALRRRALRLPLRDLRLRRPHPLSMTAVSIAPRE